MNETIALGALAMLVAVSSTGSSLRFLVQVEVVSGDPPSATVVAAVDISSRPVEVFLGYLARIAC